MEHTVIFEPIYAAMRIHCDNQPDFQAADADQRKFWRAMADEVTALDGPAILIDQCEVLATKGFLTIVEPSA